MQHDVFSEGWALAWQRILNESETYRSAAAEWEGSVALVMTPDPSERIPDQRHVFLDLWHGTCRGARVATPEDLAQARFVIEASPRTWKDLLAAETSPLVALMTGHLRLARGSLLALLPYAHAARELVAAATAVQSEFPLP